MVATAAAGLIGSVVFHTDPVGGYPPGTPDMPARFSRAGIAHNLTAILVLARLPAAAASYGRRSWPASQPPGFAIYCAVTAVRPCRSPWRWPDQASASQVAQIAYSVHPLLAAWRVPRIRPLSRRGPTSASLRADRHSSRVPDRGHDQMAYRSGVQLACGLLSGAGARSARAGGSSAAH